MTCVIARLALEKKGVILFKDASANKVCAFEQQRCKSDLSSGRCYFEFARGTLVSHALRPQSDYSSPFSGLAFTDAEFLEQMTTHGDEGVSDFYADYVQEIQRTISMNAKLEFECIWKESLISNKPRATLT